MVRTFLDNGVLSSEMIVAWYDDGPPDPLVFKTKRKTTFAVKKKKGSFELVFIAFWTALS